MRALSWSLLILVCSVLGIAMAVLPFGVSLRGVVILLGILALGLAWGLRSDAYPMPSRAAVLGLLLLTVSMSILWPRYVFFPAGGVFVNPQTLTVLGSVAVCSILLVANGTLWRRVQGIGWGVGRIGWLIALWLTWRVLSSLIGEYPVASTIAVVKELIYSASFLLLAAVILSYENADRWLLRVIVFCGFVAVVYGLVEAFAQKNPLLRFASGADNDTVAEAIKSLTLEKIRGGKYRAQSFFTHPIVFAQIVAALLPMGLLLMLTERKSLIWRLVGFIVIPIGIVAIVKSGSRAGLVSLLASISFGTLVIWLRALSSRGAMRMLAVVGFPLFLFVCGLVYWLAQDLFIGRTAGEAGSTAARLQMLRLGMAALASHPIAGYGDGMSVGVAGLTDSSGHTSIDSYLLTVAVDSGYVGLCLFLAIMVVFAVKSAIVAARQPGEDGLRVGMVAAAVMAVFVTYAGLSIAHNMTLLWILMVLGLSYIRRLDQPASAPSQAPRS